MGNNKLLISVCLALLIGVSYLKMKKVLLLHKRLRLNSYWRSFLKLSKVTGTIKRISTYVNMKWCRFNKSLRGSTLEIFTEIGIAYHMAIKIVLGANKRSL